ncbi:MAG: FtsX-like permease family protein [Chloroflexi bacterium]|nr:FtsX-like permease family protein [Chloroflexota bacterium]
MPSPRWRKVLRDLWNNKTHTLLVALSIAAGIFAVGMVAGSYAILSRELTASYLAINPPSASFYTDPFDDDQVEVVRRMPGVLNAEGTRRIRVRIKTGPDQWQPLILQAIPDFENIEINQIQPFGGDWPPPKRQLLIERASLSLTQAQIGDSITIETPANKQYNMRIAGLAYDLNEPPTQFTGQAFGYVTSDTIEWLGYPRTFSQLNIVVEGNTLDEIHIREVANQVRDKIEQGGRRVYSVYIPTPGQHPADREIQPLLLILSVLGFLSLLASGFLIVNTISATITQQTRQIGVMKAVGGRRIQITLLYLGMVFAFSVIALIIAMPLAELAADAITAYIAGLINTDIRSYALPPQVLILEIAVGLIVPFLATLFPIIRGTHISVRQALSDYGLNTQPARGFVDRLVDRVPGNSRPFLLSIRNTFRRKARLALMLSTLMLGGATFISVLSVRDSFLSTIIQAYQFWGYDVQVNLGQHYRTDLLQQKSLNVPGIASAESWTFGNVRRIRPDGTESDNLTINGVPAQTNIIQPTILQGRWLVPDDENAVVVNTDLLKDEPDIKVGDELTFKFDTDETQWRVVGIIRSSLSGSLLFANYPYASRVFHSVGHSSMVLLNTEQHDGASTSQIAKQLETRFKDEGLRVSLIQTIDDMRTRTENQVNILVVFLLIMAFLLALVAGLGMMGTMSLNVLERTREIGVLRAIGASDGAVLLIVISEGVLIAILSWVGSVILAFPLSQVLSDVVGNSFVNNPLDFTFSISGSMLWLALVILLAALASFMPARRASNLTVREVLAYE